ncbi:hypothetical protein AXG93_3037s1070 [Marchantia polymorpha subsp. ruderalis]|uniref:Uncharacterized protein n=1 Tax=Marchantia polymorpha subsp. ruderalis TaxID=1480154 RepID=A0A176WM03_MARPO|nr:hypothetical protein AXG93_3037s1070 [Marchantia polymorpha subsp. ruderalis]
MADDDVEMDVIREEEMESASLLSSSAKEKSASLARAAYRAELASKRAALLAILIIPILVMIVLWHVSVDHCIEFSHALLAGKAVRTFCVVYQSSFEDLSPPKAVYKLNELEHT